MRPDVAERAQQRITELRETRIVSHQSGGYRLTAEGARLLTSIAPLDDWAKRWARRHD
jgi:DNA-binding HxlR family transcriptional regulator